MNCIIHEDLKSIDIKSNNLLTTSRVRNQKLLTLILFSWLTFSCQHDEPVQRGNVQFSFNNISADNTGGRKQTDQIPDGASLIISITKSNGDSVFTWKKMELLKVGNQFITSPLPLLQGGYIVTDFMIVGPDNTVLFVAPKEGSLLAGLATKTIPLFFNVNANSIANVSVEVVDAHHKNPEDFGYASFPIHVIPQSGFAINTFVHENGQTNLTTAQAYVLHEQDTILGKKLSTSTNFISWDMGTNSRFSLVIVKDGYAHYEKEFDLDSMMTALNGQPLTVLLQPALTITWNTGDIYFTANGSSGSKIKIDWGDDSDIETITFPHENAIAHNYPSERKYFTSVTGDLTSVQELDLSGTFVDIDTLSITHLPALKRFGFSFVHYSSGVDFSHNPQLEFIGAIDLMITQFDISKNPALNDVRLAFTNLSTATIDKAIDDLYASVVLTNRRNGYLLLSNSDFPDHKMIGPPSPAQIQKLYSLINDYGWRVDPL